MIDLILITGLLILYVWLNREFYFPWRKTCNELKFNIETIQVKAASRKLTAHWCFEIDPDDDEYAFHPDLEEELVKMLKAKI